MLNLFGKSNVTEQPWFILLMVLAILGVIILFAIVIKRYVLKTENEDKKDEQTLREEKLNSLLEPITDEESLKQMSDYDKESK